MMALRSARRHQQTDTSLMTLGKGVLALLVVMVLPSCSATTAYDDVVPTPDMVTPQPIGERVFVAPKTMVSALMQAGLSSAEIMKYGPHAMELISDHGGAELYIDGELQYVLSVFSGKLYVSSLQRGLVVVENYI